MMRCYWLDIKGLGLLCTLSVRLRQSASDGRFWRAAVRAIFPLHPFEVSRFTLVGCDQSLHLLRDEINSPKFNCYVGLS